MQVRVTRPFRSLFSQNSLRFISTLHKNDYFLTLVKNGELEKVKKAIKTNPTLRKAQYAIDKYDKERGNTALHVAFEFGQPEIAEVLLNPTKEYNDLLFKHNAIDVPPWVYFFIYMHNINKKSSQPNLLDSIRNIIFSSEEFTKNTGVLFESIKALHMENVISLYPNIHTSKDAYGFNLLQYAIATNNIKYVEEILNNADTIEKKKRLLFNADVNGNISLHIAILNTDQNSGILEFLLKTASSLGPTQCHNYLYTQNNFGYDPFFVALSFSNVEFIFKLLFEYGYDVRRPNYAPAYDIKMNPLEKEYDDELFIKHGYKINHCKLTPEVYKFPSPFMPLKWSHDDKTALKVLEWLFRHGVDITSPKLLSTFQQEAETIITYTDQDSVTTEYSLLWDKAYKKNEPKEITVIDSIDFFKRTNWEESKKFLKFTGFHDASEITRFASNIIHGRYTEVEKQLKKDPKFIEVSIVIQYSDRKITYTPFLLSVIHGQDTIEFGYYRDKTHYQKMTLDTLIFSLEELLKNTSNPVEKNNKINETILRKIKQIKNGKNENHQNSALSLAAK